jgi:hypothetical protein
MWLRLKKWQNNFDGGMTKDKYLLICNQLGEEPSEERCPPDFDDFPSTLQQAIEVFNKLGDRVYPDIGYMGKDYTSLELHMRVAKVDNEELFLEALLRLDAHLIKRSSEELKKARDKVKKT